VPQMMASPLILFSDPVSEKNDSGYKGYVMVPARDSIGEQDHPSTGTSRPGESGMAMTMNGW
jgi:hypothetical protein